MFADVTFSRTPLVAASENLKNAQKKISLQLKLCLCHIYFHSYSLLLVWQKCPRISFLIMFYFKEYYRKKCVTRNFSWNSKKPSGCPEVFCSKDFLENFAKFTRKLLCRSLLFKEVADWTTPTLLKVQGISCEFCKLRTIFCTIWLLFGGIWHASKIMPYRT